MATVKGCNIPEDLYYNVENNVWTRAARCRGCRSFWAAHARAAG